MDILKTAKTSQHVVLTLTNPHGDTVEQVTIDDPNNNPRELVAHVARFCSLHCLPVADVGLTVQRFN